MNDEIKQLINKLDLEESRKQALLDKLEQNGVTEELAMEVQKLLQENEAEIRAEAPELMVELDQAHRQAAEQIEQAYKEFNVEMDQFDKDASALQSQASKDLDDAQLEESRAALS